MEVDITEKSKRSEKEKKSVEIESSVTIRQDREYKHTFNPIYRQMMDAGIV